jgi:phage/plasmid-like protein (TIGR03299 family)
MAHEISNSDGINEMAYFGAAPWHGLGQSAAEAMTAAQALALGHLDWPVSLRPVRVDGGALIPGLKAVTRDDTGAALGVVGSAYRPVPNAEAFGFLDAITGPGFRYHTVGALNGGARVWMLGKLAGSIGVKDDRVDKYLLFSNSHDGRGAVDVRWTMTRVVCANTLAVALKGHGDSIKVRHTGDLAGKMTEAARVLGLAERYFDDAEGFIRRLATTGLSTSQLDTYFKALYPDTPKKEDSTRLATTRTENIRKAIWESYETAPGQDCPGVQGTAWGAYNAVSHYLTHKRPVRGTAGDETSEREGRLKANWFRDGHDLLVRAADLAMAMSN